MTAVHRIDALDGLRAIAILAVIANHTGVALAKGGYLGVDVFFVLSGYLITGLLLRERERYGRIQLRLFYARRALRLWPALIVAVLFAAVLALAGVVPSDRFSAHAVIALLYLQDLANAFGLGPPLGPLNTTWSLAIEEHFYLLWPLVLIVAARRGRRAVLFASVLLASLSFVAMQVLFAPFPPPTAPVYYHPEARAAGLLVGCAVAALPVRRVPAWWAVPATLVVGSTMLFSPEANVRSAYAISMPLIWLATGALILAIRDQPTPISPLLTWRPVVWIGSISYGLYLFHPLTFFLANAVGGSSRPVVVAIGTGLAFVLAAGCYYGVETYFNRVKDRRFRPQAVPQTAGPREMG